MRPAPVRQYTGGSLSSPSDTKSLIDEITEEAQNQLASNREDASRLKAEIAEMDKLCAGYMRLLLDPDISKVAKSEIDLQLQRFSAEKHELKLMLDRIGDRAARIGDDDFIHHGSDTAECVLDPIFFILNDHAQRNGHTRTR